MIEISSCMNSLVIWPPPSHQTIPTKPNHTIPNLCLYLQLSITAISIHNATLLSCHFQKIATVSHFRLVWGYLWHPEHFKAFFLNPMKDYWTSFTNTNLHCSISVNHVCVLLYTIKSPATAPPAVIYVLSIITWNIRSNSSSLIHTTCSLTHTKTCRNQATKMLGPYLPDIDLM